MWVISFPLIPKVILTLFPVTTILHSSRNPGWKHKVTIDSLSPHFILVHIVCVCVCVCSHSVVSDFLRPSGLQPARLLCPWGSPGKNTGVGCHCLLQGIFPTQGLNLGLLHCRQTLYPLSHQGSHKSYLPNYVSDKGTLSEIYKECLKLKKKKKNTIINESKSWHFVTGRYRYGK